jgi:autonomous glycyl radical cofactor GrcA
LIGGANVTQAQYETFENSQFLTAEEKEHERELNTKNGYGLSYNQMMTLKRKHKAARNVSDYKSMAKIEYRLTGINFHSMCGQLQNGEYSAVLADIKKRKNEHEQKN